MDQYFQKRVVVGWSLDKALIIRTFCGVLLLLLAVGRFLGVNRGNVFFGRSGQSLLICFWLFLFDL